MSVAITPAFLESLEDPNFFYFCWSCRGWYQGRPYFHYSGGVVSGMTCEKCAGGMPYVL